MKKSLLFIGCAITLMSCRKDENQQACGGDYSSIYANIYHITSDYSSSHTGSQPGSDSEDFDRIVKLEVQDSILTVGGYDFSIDHCGQRSFLSENTSLTFSEGLQTFDLIRDVSSSSQFFSSSSSLNIHGELSSDPISVMPNNHHNNWEDEYSFKIRLMTLANMWGSTSVVWDSIYYDTASLTINHTDILLDNQMFQIITGSGAGLNYHENYFYSSSGSNSGQYSYKCELLQDSVYFRRSLAGSESFEIWGSKL